jgi:hypothetical protein
VSTGIVSNSACPDIPSRNPWTASRDDPWAM